MGVPRGTTPRVGVECCSGCAHVGCLCSGQRGCEQCVCAHAGMRAGCSLPARAGWGARGARGGVWGCVHAAD